MSTDTQIDPVSRQAAHWLVALQDTPDKPGIHEDFQAWLAEDPRHAQAWAETADVFSMMEQVPQQEASPEPVIFKPRRSPRRSFAFGAAGLAVAASLVLALMPNLPALVTADHATLTGVVDTINLADGSTLYLGPETAADVDFSAGERRVTLHHGEAFFDVTPDPDRPFVVVTDQMSVTALGTAFSVREFEGRFGVAMREGRVQLQGASDATLSAGDWVRLGADGELVSGTKPAQEADAWQRGQIIARNRPIGEVVNDLRRYFHGLIIIEDAAFAEKHVSGIYNWADPYAALKAISAARGGTVITFSPMILVLRGP